MKTLVARSTRMQGRHIGRLSDFTMKWFTDLYGDEWSDWTRLAIEYLAHLNEGVPLDNRKTLGNVRNDISWFLEHYLWREGFPSKTTEFFAMINSANNMTRCLGSNSSLTTREAKQRRLREIKTFVQWLMDNKENHFSNIPKSNPFVNKNSVRDGRSSDINFTWLCDKHGPNWGSWRSYATAWVSTKEGTITHFLGSLSWFFEKFLINHGYGANPIEFFQPSQTRVDINLSINSLSISNLEKARRSRQIHDFVDWVIKKDFREHDDRGKLIPMFKNPVIPMKSGYPNRNETVYNPIPYGYIKQLRAIICPAGSRSFNDWSWAHSAWRSDWIEIEDEQANKTDPNCVLKTVSDGERTKTFIWNPVRSVALLIKLHLPLRSYQVRVLDSGEADTWRYESGLWVNNNHYSFAKGTISAPWQKGVFRRILVPEVGGVMTGIYVNTNKTKDQNKDDEFERGYVIPWENTEVLYWLNALRDWQEKYNPIVKPTKWSDLGQSHIGHKKSPKTLKKIGESCFLFRDRLQSQAKNNFANADKPITQNKLNAGWRTLLEELEIRLYNSGQTLKGGSKIKFTKEDSPIGTLYPLHSLRVSLITSYAMDGQTPFPVISKLLAGHSRLLMTIYYNKINPAVMRRKMAESEALMEEKTHESISDFLEDAELDLIKSSTVYIDEKSMASSLTSRNPIGWVKKHIGLCLAGSNSCEPAFTSNSPGCWNGFIHSDGKFGSVPHGPENCVRCRWFISDASYIDALRAHFNTLSYKASQSASLALEIEQTKERLEDDRYVAEQQNKLFLKQDELRDAEERYDSQIIDADEYIKDMRECFTLIHRIIEIEAERVNSDEAQKFIAVGGTSDIKQTMSLIEADSELWQISEICLDAEIYPQLQDDIRKTPALHKRSNALNTALIRDGFAPIFMQMDEKMQIIMGNAFMRALANKVCPERHQSEGMRIVSGLIEASESLDSAGIMDEGITALETAYGSPILRISEMASISDRLVESRNKQIVGNKDYE